MRTLCTVSALLCLLALPVKGQVAVHLAPVPAQQFLSSTGLPLSGGCVFSYISGTSTPQATYADSTGLIQNANPLILDSGGFGSIWLNDAQTYRITVKSAGGVNCASGSQQRQIDGVSNGSLAAILGTNNTWTGNQTYNGNVTYNGSVTLATLTVGGAETVNGALSATAGGSLNGTWTFGGNNAFTGNNTHSGTEAFTGQLLCKDLEGVKCVDSANSQGWAGADVGAWLNAAYAALPSTGGSIYLSNLGTSCMNFSTPIVFATSGKYLILNGLQPGTSNNANPGGACLNYTPTTATDAITVDWTPLAGGGIKSGSGINNVTLINNSCQTIGGCGSSAKGIHFSTTGGGAENGLFQGLTVQGFGTGLFDNNAAAISYGMTFTNLSLVYNTTGVNLQGYESLHFFNSYAQSNGTGISIASGETTYIGGAIESNTTANFTYTGAVGLGRVNFIGTHFENLGNTTANYISGNMNLTITGGTMLDDFTAGANLNWLIQVGGNHVKVDGLVVSTTRTLGITSILNVPGPGATRGITNFMINSPTLITNRVNGGNAKAIGDMSTQPNTANPYIWNVEGCLGIGGTTGLLNTPVNLCAPATGGVTFTNNFQGVNDTFVYKATTDTLTNKTLTAPIINGTDSGAASFTGINNFPGNTAALTADWTCGTGGTVASCVAATIIGSGGGVPLTFTLPLIAQSYTLECDGVVGQATAATANQWNLLTATNGATNVTANYSMATAATASAFGAVTDQASTTTTFQIAPSWTLGGTATKMPFHIWAKIEGASASGTVVSLQLVAPTVGDLVTIYRGASCRVF